jgi:hypothetical protein
MTCSLYVEVELSRVQLHACAWRIAGGGGGGGAAIHKLGHKVGGGWVSWEPTAASIASCR